MSARPPGVEELVRENEALHERLIALETTLADQILKEKKTEHLNRVLRAIRRVNHLITREGDRHDLLQKACQALVQTRGYAKAWIALVDRQGRMTLHAEAGLGVAFLPLTQAMAEGTFPPCVDRLRAGEDLIAIRDSSEECPRCPLADAHQSNGSLALPLANDSASHGFLVISLPHELTTDVEEQRLLRHVASDLAYALTNIEAKEERRRYEETLREREARFRSIFNTSMDAIFLLDREGLVITANPAAYTMYGYDEGELLGESIHALIHPQEHDQLTGLVEELHDRGRISTEAINLRRDGTSFPVEVRSSTILLHNRPHLLSIIRDITEQKQAYLRLEKQSTLKEDLLAPAPLPEKMKRITDAVVDIFDGAFARIWLIDAGDLCDAGCIHAEVHEGPHVCRDRSRCLHLVASSGLYTHTDGALHRRVPLGAYKIGRVASAEDPGFITNKVTADPRVHDHRWARSLGLVSFAGYRLLSHEGLPLGVLALFSRQPLSPSDESMLRSIAGTASETILATQANDKIHHLRNYLHNIIDSMPSILVGIDSEGRVTQWNNRAEGASGVAVDDAIGRPLGEAFPRLADLLPLAQDTLTTRQIHQKPRQARNDAGEIRYEDMTVYPLIANGTDGVVIRVDDVTDQVRVEEMMVQSERMLSLGGLAAGMAHEINNPLGGMIQTADVMASRLTDIEMPANRRAADDAGTTMESVHAFMVARGIPRMLSRIQEGGARAAEIVSNMLRFARKGDASLSTHDIADLLDRTVKLAESDYNLKTAYDFRKIEILRDYEDNLPLVPCEASKIQQVFLNILRNGAEAMHDQADPERTPRFVLRLAHEKDTDHLRVEIEDSGPGMDEATRRRVFEPFFTTKAPNRGTGLGLSVSYFIITENHAGTLSVASIPGAGATFTLRLPLHRTEP